MQIDEYLQQLRTNPDELQFTDLLELIASHYDFTPTRFSNGELLNQPEQNQGSCKLFAFAQMHDLSEQETLYCFGEYYRDKVLQSPQGDDHQNIRNFMQSGWDGIKFGGKPLHQKKNR